MYLRVGGGAGTSWEVARGVGSTGVGGTWASGEGAWGGGASWGIGRAQVGGDREAGRGLRPVERELGSGGVALGRVGRATTQFWLAGGPVEEAGFGWNSGVQMGVPARSDQASHSSIRRNT